MGEKIQFKVDGEWFTSFIRNLYYSEDRGYEDCKDRLIKSLSLQELSEEEKDDLAKSIIFGDKKLIGVNNFELIDDIDFDVYEYSRVSRPTNFIENKGVTGILTGDVVFAECRYGGHNHTINFIDDGHQNLSGAIIFSIGVQLELVKMQIPMFIWILLGLSQLNIKRDGMRIIRYI